MKKRWIIALLCAMSMMAVTGCNKKEEPQMTQESTVTPGTEVTTTETVYVNNLDLDNYVVVKDYKNLKVKVGNYSVDDAEVEQMALDFYQSVVSLENGGVVDRAVEEGDTVIIDYMGMKDGVAFQGGTAEGASLTIGSHTFIDGFEEQLIGVMPGETKDLNLTFPEQYHSEELAGQDVVFTVTVHYIIPKEMKDEVIAQLEMPEFTTVDELRAYVREYLELSSQEEKENEIQSQILDQLINGNELKSIPDGLLEQYKENIRTGVERNAAQYGMDSNSFCNYFYGTDAESFIEEYGQRAVKQNMFCQYIANVENLNLTEEELDAKLLEYATLSGLATVEEFLDGQSKEDYREYFMFERVMEFLTENAQIIEE